MLIVRAPVRIGFFGGGTDLPSYYNRHGGAVINASINKYFYVLVTEQPENQVQIISSDYRVMQQLDELTPDRVEGELKLPVAAIKHVGLDRGANLFLASEIPPGTGLGSSGAVSVCMVKALSAFQDRSLDAHAVAETACFINSELLGHPGGKQDEYGSAFGGLKHITFTHEGTTVRPLDLDPIVFRELESNLMLFFTGSSRESANILTKQRTACEDDQVDVVETLHTMRGMVEEGLAILESGNLRPLGDLLHRSWEAKKRVADGISNTYIDDLYLEAREAGALGGKIAGAGGGGFLMLYCEEEARPRVSQLMRERGAREMLFSFDFDGATVLYDDPIFDAQGGAMREWKMVEFL